MTREERAREALLKAVAPSEDGWIECRPDWIIDHMLAFADAEAAAMRERTFQIGDRVEKISGSSWRGKVVGTYSTTLTPEGYAVESDTETGSVQIYPAKALRFVRALPATGEVGRG